MNNIIAKLFCVACVLATVGLQIKCLYKYCLNEDVSRVIYKRFHSEKNAIYPSISFCIINPFLEKEVQKYGDGINVTSYSYFLQGLLWDERMLKINYDSVTVSLTENLRYFDVVKHDTYMRNMSIYRLYDSTGFLHDAWKPSFNVSFRGATRKCFTTDIPFMERTPIWYYEIRIQNSIFPHGKRPAYYDFDGSNPDTGGGFFVYFHYPGQLFPAYHTLKYVWESRPNNTKDYYMVFRFKDIRVMRSRNKQEQPCIQNWKRYDLMLRDEILQGVGCRPPHWSTNVTLPLCTNSEDMKYFANKPNAGKVESFGTPCNVIEGVRYRYFDLDYPNQGKETEILQYLCN